MQNNINQNNLQRGNSTLAFKAGFWYVFANFMGKAVAFITTPIFARLMTTSDYGEFSNFAGWLGIFLSITGVELHNNNVISRAYIDFNKKFDDFISSVTFLGCAITVGTYLFFLIFQNHITKIVAIPVQYVHILFLSILFSFCRSMYYARERTLYRYKSVAIISFLSLFLPTVISVALVYYLPPLEGLSARIYGFYFPSALFGLFCTVSIFKKSLAFEWRYCKYALYLSLPLLVHFFVANLLTSTNVIIAKSIKSAEAAAIMSIATSVTIIFTIFFQSTSGAITTWIMDNLELGKNKLINQGIFFYVVLLSVMVVATILLIPELIYILGGEKYLAAIPLLPGLLFATYLQAVSTVFTIILSYDKNVVQVAFYSGVFALLSVVAKIWFLPVYGLVVLAYVNIAVFSVLLVINYVLVRKSGYADVISMKGIVLSTIMAGTVMIFSPQLNHYNFLRYTLIGTLSACFLLLAFFNKKRIAGYLKSK